MLTGRVIGSGVATGPGNYSVTYRMIVPEKTTENLRLIAAEGRRWGETADRFLTLARQRVIDSPVAERAFFAHQVIGILGENLRLGICCAIVAVSPVGQFLGIIVYMYRGFDEGLLNFAAIDPVHLPGAPGNLPVRGVGTALVAAASQEMLAHPVSVIYLHPYDAEAERFWRNRGFQTCGEGGRLCVRGAPAIGALIDGCQRIPDCTGDDCLSCGRPMPVYGPPR